MNTLKLMAADRIIRMLSEKLNTTDQNKAKEIEFLLRRIRVSSMVQKKQEIKCGSYYN